MANLYHTFQKSLSRTIKVLTAPVYALARKTKTLLSPQSLFRKASNEVITGVKQLKEPPTSLQDYTLVGSYYVAKKLLFLLVVVGLALPTLFLQ